MSQAKAQRQRSGQEAFSVDLVGCRRVEDAGEAVMSFGPPYRVLCMRPIGTLPRAGVGASTGVRTVTNPAC